MCTSTHDGTWQHPDPAEHKTLAEALATRGLQPTLSREVVYDVVLSCPGHICAEHVRSVVAERRPELHINMTTVYRTLELLTGLGLVSAHNCGAGAVQYEPAARGRHSHLLCRRCGTLANLDPDIAESLRSSLLTRHHFLAEIGSHPILGTCAACQS